MTTRIKLICQASTSAIRTSAFPNDEGIEPTAGQKLARATYRLGRIDRTFTSPAPAARQTAEALGLRATLEPALRECDYGRWAGRPMADVHDREAHGFSVWLTQPGAAPHGGESMLAVMKRVGTWLDLQQGAVGTLAVVTHASVIRAAIVHALGAPPSAFWRIDVAPLVMVKLIGSAGRWSLASVGQMLATGPEA